MEYQRLEPCRFCLYIKLLENIKTEMKPNPLINTKKTEDENIAEIFAKKLKKDYKNDL